MSNTLTKHTYTTYYDGSPAQPAVAEVPYVPGHYAGGTAVGWEGTEFGYDEYSYKWSEYWTARESGRRISATADIAGRSVALDTPRRLSLTDYINKYYPLWHAEAMPDGSDSVLVLRWVPEQAYVPAKAAVAATPPRTEVNYNLGWNAGARSIGFLAGSGAAEFKAPASLVGAVAGLSSTNPDAGFVSIEHAFCLMGRTAYVYERGYEKRRVGPYAAGDTFRVRRDGATVSYWHNGAKVYTSEARSVDVLCFDVSLYSGGDYIYDPVITAWDGGYGGCDAPMHPATGYGSDGAYQASTASLRPLTGVGGASARNVGYMAPLAGSGGVGSRRGSCAGAMAPLRGEAVEDRASGVLVPRYALAAGTMAPIGGDASGLTGGIGSCRADMRPAWGRGSDHAYGEGVVKIPPLTGWAHAYEGNAQATMIETVLVLASFPAATTTLYVTMTTDLSAATVFAVQVLDDAAMPTNVSVLTSADTIAILEALMRTTLSVGASVPAFSTDNNMCWVLNTETGATSRYENFGYNSYCQLDGRYYGCKPDGVYLLEGDSDNGLPIQAMIDLGRQDFGTSALKSVPTAYVGVSSTGAMVLKAIVEGATYHYTARDSSPNMQQQRIDLGRGLRANYFTFQLFNSDGADFEIDSIAFTPLASARRI